MTTENIRYQLQFQLDKEKSQEQRNVLGQFSTPYALAKDIVAYALTLLPRDMQVRLLEPACGTGVFFSALQESLGEGSLHGSLGFEIDGHYHAPSADLWRQWGVEIRCEDFLAASPSRLFPLLIANPPYTRHHHLSSEQKRELQAQVLRKTGIKVSGLSGLYCYFMLLSTQWLEEGGVSCWLVPSEFMDVNYGQAVKQFLLEQVELIRVHRFDEKDVQFTDALVSSSIVVFRNVKPSAGNKIRFTYGGTITRPRRQADIERDQIKDNCKWSRCFREGGSVARQTESPRCNVLGDYFNVKRGIATGSNSFFMVDEDTIARYHLPMEYLTPILPAPRKMNTDRVKSENGIPIIENRRFLFSTDDSLETIARKYPDVLEYIRKGVEENVDKTYICSRHTPWYSCEKRSKAPFVVPYMGRGENGHKMFRFILNQSDAIATNGYLLIYPKPEFAHLFRNPDLVESVWQRLNTITTEDFERHGRVYGGGLHKLEPRELLSIPLNGLDKLLGKNALWQA